MRGAARRLIRFVAYGFLRLFRRGQKIFESLIYATFTSAELDALTVNEWEAFGDAGSLGAPTLFDWELALFAEHLRPHDSMLVVGAGSGRDVLPLLASGHAVTALDITPRALALLERRAVERGLDVTTICASITDADLGGARFDVVLFSWFTIGYLRGPRERAKALEKSREALLPGGRVIVTYVPDPSAEEKTVASPFANAVAAALGGVSAEPGDHCNVTGSASNPAVYLSHIFRPADLEREVLKAGFEIVAHTQPANSVGAITLRSA